MIVRANYANRFREDTAQYEIDAYPRLAKGLYAYVNYGYSSHRFFPKNRVGGELYANLPHGVELSGGFRWLQFESSEVTIYTGTIAKYQGNYWISLRPYITPKSEGTSQSYNLTVRRYFGGPDNYLGVYRRHRLVAGRDHQHDRPGSIRLAQGSASRPEGIWRLVHVQVQRGLLVGGARLQS